MPGGSELAQLLQNALYYSVKGHGPRGLDQDCVAVAQLRRREFAELLALLKVASRVLGHASRAGRGH